MDGKKSHLSPEIIRKIKQLEIYTRRLLNGSLVGDTRSAIKGTGFEFDQIREYTFGDDIRFIDWKASARSNKILVKQYVEERSRTIFLVVDISHSRTFGSGKNNKHEMLAEIASILALVAQHGKDRVALVLFSDEIEMYIPPAGSLFHVRTIMESLFSYQPKRTRTSVAVALEYLLSLKKGDAIVFLLSDFIDDELGTYLAQAAHRYDLVAVRCLDDNEKIMPAVGFVTVQDLETGEFVELDVRGGKTNELERFLGARLEEQNKLFKKYGVDLLDVAPKNDDYIATIVKFFRRRMMY